MKATVSTQEVQLALESKIGKELSSSEDFSKAIASVLNAWSFQPDELAGFAKQLEEAIFQEIYTRLGRGMRYRSRNGDVIHVYSEDLPELADRCLALLLPRFSPSAEAYAVLQPMAFEQGSYAAMLTLYRRYPEQLGKANLDLIASMMTQRAQGERLPELLYP